jgi:7,8-dihydro-6-hydroxymethylpterin dimethyltransferase
MPELATRDYLYYDLTLALCSVCLRKVEAKTALQDGCVYLLKRCPQHGAQKVLIADDVEYYRRAREVFLKPGELPLVTNTPTRWGCPFDCGLCPDHEQHSCLSLIEVTDGCNLQCPTCYAASGPGQAHRNLQQIEAMLDAVVRNEGKPDVVQISGGEPTIHPDFYAILDAAKARPIQHLMVNTNGIRIARDPEFAARLATYRPGFEIYLQFDSLEEAPLRTLRAEDLRAVRQAALENLERHGIPTNLVVTLRKGLNDHEVGAIIQHALTWKCVRGVTFQPVQHAGRADDFDPAEHRLTLTETRRLIAEQSGVFAAEDIVPVPCHPDCIAMGYALRLDEKVVPLTGLVGEDVLLQGQRATIAIERDAGVQAGARAAMLRLLSAGNGEHDTPGKLRDLLCCLPRIDVGSLGYENVFRVIIMRFMDAHDLDVRSVKRSCVHIVHPDGRIIPFDTYNLFYRGDLEERVLAPLRSNGHG